MSVKFNLETPVGNSLEGISRVSGWYIPDHSLRPQLYVACNGKREAALEWGSIRPDVSSVYPAQSQSIISGFQGDLLVGEHVQGQELDVAVLDAEGHDRELFRRTYVLGSSRPLVTRDRSFNLFDLLVCPECRSPLAKQDPGWTCPRCAMPVPSFGEACRIFFTEQGIPCLHLSEQTTTHPYSSDVLEILDAIRAGWCSISGRVIRRRNCYALRWYISMPYSTSGRISSAPADGCRFAIIPSMPL